MRWFSANWSTVSVCFLNKSEVVDPFVRRVLLGSRIRIGWCWLLDNLQYSCFPSVCDIMWECLNYVRVRVFWRCESVPRQNPAVTDSMRTLENLQPYLGQQIEPLVVQELLAHVEARPFELPCRWIFNHVRQYIWIWSASCIFTFSIECFLNFYFVARVRFDCFWKKKAGNV